MITKRMVVIKLTAHEANWLVKKLEGIEQAGKRAEAAPLTQRDGFMAESLIDRLESEGQTV